ncbi:hypothetical protein FMK83_13860 [Klebsiella oxytoca]|nr:hypothetical protein [Klebsiella oxytoca]
MNDAGIHECFPFSDFEVLKPSPVELPGRGFDVFAGTCCSFPLVLFLHPFESRSPQGRKRAPAMADVQGAVYRVPFTLDG